MSCPSKTVSAPSAPLHLHLAPLCSAPSAPLHLAPLCSATRCLAIAVFNDKKIRGTVRFSEQADGKVAIDVDLQGLKKNALHGFHVHQYGDMSQHCDSMCAHFNPYGEKHGCPGSKHRHVGDLGNLSTDQHGCARYRFYDDVIRLRGSKANIVGRGLVIHADPDDCGKGGNNESLVTGNAGKRIACAVIGLCGP